MVYSPMRTNRDFVAHQAVEDGLIEVPINRMVSADGRACSCGALSWFCQVNPKKRGECYA